MAFISIQGKVFRFLRSKLIREGVFIGESAGYPRVELHTFTEGEPLDKDGQMRELTCQMESLSVQSYGEAVAMNEENLVRVISEDEETFEDISISGVIFQQLTESIDSLDTKEVLYRQVSSIKIIAG